MNAITDRIIAEDLPDTLKILELNKKTNRIDLIKRNTLGGCEQASFVVISVVREGEANLKPHVTRLQEWHKLSVA